MQRLIAQNFKANGINGYCYNFEKNQNSFEIYKKVNI